MIAEWYRKLAPLFIRKYVYRRMARRYYRQYFERLSRLQKDENTAEIYREELSEIMRTKAVYMINRRYRKEDYLPEKIIVYKDTACGMRYVLVGEKKLYYPRSWSKAQIRFYHNSLLAEMDERSPHCYVGNDFSFKDGQILFDLGGAEGFFTLLNIDKLSKAYVFECDSLWEEPLRHTFLPWADKVSVEKMYIGDENKAGFTTMDAFTQEHLPEGSSIFVKCDIEGAEEAFLRGAENTLAAYDVDLAICLYHRKDAEERIIGIFVRNGWKYSFGTGYLFPVGFEKDLPYPCFRRGMVRCSIRHSQTVPEGN